MHPYLVLLHQAEYHQLLRKGQLQALPASRFLSPATDPELAVWLTEHPAPLAQPTAWLLLLATSATMPLAIEQTAFDAPLPLDPAAVEQLLAQAPPPTVPQSWLQKLLETIRQGNWLQDNLPHGMVVVARYGDHPEKQAVIPIAPTQYLRPQDIGKPEKWEQAIPDIADEDGAILIPLSRPFAQPLTKDHLAKEVFALTERGKSLLVSQAGYPASISAKYHRQIQPILDQRRAADRNATALRVANLVPLKPADQEKLCELQAQLRAALTHKYQSEAPLATFWDAMLAYERTGEGAEAIPTTSRGYLKDIGNTVKKFLSARKSRGEFDVDTSLHIKALLGQWGQVMDDSSLDGNAGAVFTPKYSANSLIQQLNYLLQVADFNALAAAYLYFLLRDTIGNKEQDLTADLLQRLLEGAKSIKLDSELSLALYAIGLLEPNHRFVAAQRNSPVSALPASSQVDTIAQVVEDVPATEAKPVRPKTAKSSPAKSRNSSPRGKKGDSAKPAGSIDFNSSQQSVLPTEESLDGPVNLASITQ